MEEAETVVSSILNCQWKVDRINGVDQLFKEKLFKKIESHTKDVYYKLSVIIQGCKYSIIFIFMGNYLLTICSIFSKNS